jgi:hypothetical protein
MANDSSLLPTAGVPPGQAPYYTAETVTTIPDEGGTVTGKSIAFDYSDHLDRVVTALEQLSLSMAFIADKMDNISNKIDNISDRMSNISENSNSITSSQAVIADKQSAIEIYQKKLKELAEGNGIRIVTPYEWVTLVSIYKLLIEENGLINGIRELTESEKNQAQERISSYLSKIQEFFPPTF